MKLEKDKIIEAAKAFNDAKSFDEFKIKIDLLNIKLEDFEKSYYELAKITHPILLNVITDNGKYNFFNSKLYMEKDPHNLPGIGCLKVLSRFKLPLWIEVKKNKFENIIKLLMPNHLYINTSYSLDFEKELSTMGIDINKEMAMSLMFELAQQ